MRNNFRRWDLLRRFVLLESSLYKFHAFKISLDFFFGFMEKGWINLQHFAFYYPLWAGFKRIYLRRFFSCVFLSFLTHVSLSDALCWIVLRRVSLQDSLDICPRQEHARCASFNLCFLIALILFSFYFFFALAALDRISVLFSTILIVWFALARFYSRGTAECLWFLGRRRCGNVKSEYWNIGILLNRLGSLPPALLAARKPPPALL